METSKNIAGLIGPILMVLSVSEFLNFRIWTKVEATVVYLNGLLLFTGGLALIRSHNNWTIDWTILITLVGWLSLALGLYRTFFPHGKQLRRNAFLYVTLGTLFIVGISLTVKAYF
ncbi:hypothetical protein [Spirosoma arcticum]